MKTILILCSLISAGITSCNSLSYNPKQERERDRNDSIFSAKYHQDSLQQAKQSWRPFGDKKDLGMAD